MDSDTLALLEDRIVRAVETVNRLKREKDAALAAAAELAAERDALKADKETVRKRIEKLLATIDSLASS